MKICKECGIEYNESAYSCNTKYCSPFCRRLSVTKRNRTKKEAEQNKLDSDPVKYRSEIIDFIFKRYFKSALSRGHDFDLSKNDFNELYQDSCYYCGDKVKYIGIDRIDNSIGYNKSNIVSCCTVCNLMKREKSKLDFINHCKKITENHKNAN